MLFKTKTDEPNFGQILEAINNHKLILLIATVVVTALSLPFALNVKPQYEAVVVLQVGSYGKLELPVQKYIFKMYDPNFIKGIFDHLAINKEDISLETALFRKTFKAQYFRDASTVQITFRSYSQDLIKNILSATVFQAKSILDSRIIQEISLNTADLERVKSDILRLSSLQSRESFTKNQSKGEYERDIKELLTLVLDREILDLKDRERDLIKKLDPNFTYVSKVIDQPQTSSEPVTMGKVGLVISASIVGFLLGVLVVLLKTVAVSSSPAREFVGVENK